MIDVERYKSICIVRKDTEARGTEVCQCVEDIFMGDGKKDFNLSYWINPDRSELFFAKCVVLVEGPTEKTCIPLIAKRLGVFRYDYTLVDCGSKGSIPLYAQLLNKFRIPYVVIYDLDHKANKSQDAVNSADKSTALVVDALDPTLARSIVFVNDIEEELGMPAAAQKNKPYAALMHIDSPGFALTAALEEKIRSIYS